jgi:pSer/pThr/pTyr-binding forkhead associated (FHA) protein
MDKIIIKVPQMPAREVELANGVHKVGRSPAADLQIEHSSVSGSHCEMMVNDGMVTVKDLGSTNGTFLDGQPVRECQVGPGQTLRLGKVEVLYGVKSGLKLAAVSAGDEPPARPAPLPFHRPPRPPKIFYKSVPGAFIYPFKRNGLLLLASGTLIFGVLVFVLNFRFNGMLMVGGTVSLLFSAAIIGYIFLFMQQIITSTAQGEDEMPSWPDYESFWESVAWPYVRLLGICAACIAPSSLLLIFFGRASLFLYIPLLVLGFCYAPMALLAVAMDDSLLGLNPLLVIPSILRVPWEYLVSCLLLAALLIALGALTLLADRLHHRLASEMLAIFLTLYFAVVEMRLIGLLYYTRKDRIGWRA